MKIEHVACNVADPVAMAAWYTRHLGLRIVRSTGEPVHARFLADDGGSVMLEVYRNAKAAIPDYASMNPLILHLAFLCDNVDTECRRLVEAGASVADEPMTTPAGDRLAMLRDPWGLALQLVHRSQPMI